MFVCPDCQKTRNYYAKGCCEKCYRKSYRQRPEYKQKNREMCARYRKNNSVKFKAYMKKYMREYMRKYDQKKRLKK